MALHPSTRILFGLSLVVLSSVLGLSALAALVLIQALALSLLKDSTTWRWIRRARLLLAVPPLISGYTLAGDGIVPMLDVWSPTWQGLAHGGLQSLRLLAAILSLRLALRTLSIQQLSAGLTAILAPLSFAGVEVPTLARRLSLTFQYLEELNGKKASELLRGGLVLPMSNIQTGEPAAPNCAPIGFLNVGLLMLAAVIVLSLLV